MQNIFNSHQLNMHMTIIKLKYTKATLQSPNQENDHSIFRKVGAKAADQS